MNRQVFLRKAKNILPYFKRRISLTYKWWLSGIAKRSALVILFPSLVPKIWKRIGVNMGKNVCFGQDVYIDVDYAKNVTIEDDVWIASKTSIFAHRRVMDDYHKGERYKDCPQKERPVLIKKGACIGIGTLITPGITIGEGSVIGAGSVVVKDIPDWCLAAGSPCRVMRYLPEKGFYYNKETKQNEPIVNNNTKL